MKKLRILFAAVALAAAAVPATAYEFSVNGVRESNVCSGSNGLRYTYEPGFYGPVGTPCTWMIGRYQFWGVFGG